MVVEHIELGVVRNGQLVESIVVVVGSALVELVGRNAVVVGNALVELVGRNAVVVGSALVELVARIELLRVVG